MIDKHLSVVWIGLLERFCIVWKDPRTGTQKSVLLIEEDNGDFRPLDRRALIYASQCVSWKTLYKYPDMKDMWNHLQSQWAKRREKKINNRKDYVKWWNHEHRKEWKAALENARRGIFSRPEEREKKIIIIGGGSHVKTAQPVRLDV